MARIPYPNLDDLPEKLRTRVAALPPLNILRMFLHAPTNAAPLMSLGESILLHQELDPRLRELAILRVAHLTGANYEWTQHVPIAKQTGVTDAQVAAIPQGADAAVFDDLDKRVLRFTDEVTVNVKALESTFRALAERLSPRQLMELTLAVGFYGLVARVMETFEVELEPTAGTYSVEQLRREG
jgi:4-carboxymuconolactone decarboxylase